MTSPGEIIIALHYWTTPGDYPHLSDDLQPSYVGETVTKFLEAGLLRACQKGVTSTSRLVLGQKYEATDAMRVYIDAICAVPFPIQQWVIPKVEPE